MRVRRKTRPSAADTAATEPAKAGRRDAGGRDTGGKADGGKADGGKADGGKAVDKTAAGGESTDRHHDTIRAEDLVKARTRFLAAMSHDLRAPLNAVLGLVELLRATPLDDRQNRYVAGLVDATEHLREVIGGIHDFTQIDAGNLTLDEKPFDLPDLIERTRALMAPEARLSEVGIDIDRPRGLPMVWRGDPARLRQLLLNLMACAMRRAETQVAVGVASADDGGLALTVTDDGPPLPEGRLEALLPGTTEDGDESPAWGDVVGEGLGLELALARNLANAMGGVIAGEREDERTVVHVTLPVRPTEEPIERAKATPAPLPEARVLLVEDSELNAMVFRDTLADTALTVDWATDGARALTMFKQSRYDLVLMDIALPVMNGHEATMAIRAWEQRKNLAPVPIIAVTANAFRDDREAALLAGCTDYLAKPVRRATLIETLERYLNNSHRDRGRKDHAALDDHALAHLLPSFFAEMRADATLMTAALDRGDRTTLKRLAHSTRGHCQLFGFADLARELAALENEAEDGAPPELNGHLAEAMNRLAALSARYRG